jgi:hypothetical protein
VISQLEACLRPGPQAAADAMTPSAGLDVANPNLSQYLSSMWRDGGTLNTGRSNSGQVSAAMAAMPITRTEATEVTDNIKSGETDPEKLSKLRVSTALASPIVVVAPAPAAQSVQPTSTPTGRGLYVAIACGAIILLGLAAAVALFLMLGR